ncbi:origin recognition complex subunit 5, partial [Brachionus plicatilis]
LRYFSDSSNLLLTLSKLDEYINMGDSASTIKISSIFVSEIDWHSLISDCDLMSKTESPRPFVIYFDDYNKEQMNQILKQSAIALLSMQPEQKKRNYSDIEFYTRIILDVFYPICKDLNEIQYLIQIYYEQLLSSMQNNDKGKDSYEKMMIAWNKMKPFLKQALTQIYLRQSMFTSTARTNKLASPARDEILSLEFESLNILNEKSEGYLSEINAQMPVGCNQLPKLMKYLLISSYIATHNPAKYDKKLLDYNSTGKSRKSRFTAQKIQQNEENQRSAALKTQAFDSNRLMAIFLTICSESGHNQVINLSQIQLNLKTLKSLHYLFQSNSSYSSLDEPKYKCLIDFETILNLSNSLGFNIKQYLVEYITI